MDKVENPEVIVPPPIPFAPPPAPPSTPTPNTAEVTSTVPPTPTPASSAVTTTDVEGPAGAADEAENEDVITGVAHGRRIVLTKRSYLLIAFLLVWGLSITGTVFGYRRIEETGVPPTEYSQEAFESTFLAMIFLTIVTPLGLIILKFRIANLLIGFVYMYLLVLYLIYPSKAVITGLLSYQTDTDTTILAYVPDTHEEERLHLFWSRIQTKLGCCGTKEIDRVNDWSRFLNSSDIPFSCCTQEQVDHVLSMRNSSSSEDPIIELHYKESCGRGLARTRTAGYDRAKPPPVSRVFSGFFMAMTAKERLNAVNAFGLLDPTNKLDVKMLNVLNNKIEEVEATSVFFRNWKSFFMDSVCNTEDKLKQLRHESLLPDCEINPGQGYRPNDVAHPPDLFLENVNLKVGVADFSGEKGRAALHDCMEGSATIHSKNGTVPLHIYRRKNWTEVTAKKWCEEFLKVEFREPVATLGRELLLRLDVLTSYIHEFRYENDDDMKDKWFIWEIPTDFKPNEVYPYKLASNLLRGRWDRYASIDEVQGQMKRMYYLSRGITENFLLRGIVHKDTCEFTKEKYREDLKSKIARDLNKRWRLFVVEKWKNKEDGLGQVFLHFIHEIAFLCVCVSGACMVCVLVIAIVFWQYYSRIKAEEYANLALPKEFEVLHLRRGSGIDAEDIALSARQRAALRKSRKFRRSGRKVGPLNHPLHNTRVIV